MRGKLATITFYPPSYTRDDLGRRTRNMTPAATVLGAASTPRLSKQVSPTGERIDLVVHYAVGTYAPLDDAVVRVNGVDYSVVSISGGRRIYRLDLARFVRKDRSSGRP